MSRKGPRRILRQRKHERNPMLGTHHTNPFARQSPKDLRCSRFVCSRPLLTQVILANDWAGASNREGGHPRRDRLCCKAFGVLPRRSCSRKPASAAYLADGHLGQDSPRQDAKRNWQPTLTSQRTVRIGPSQRIGCPHQTCVHRRRCFLPCCTAL